MTTKKLSRKEKEFITHKNEIISIAREMFTEKGFVESSMNEIAEAAEFSVGTLYKFFKNKESLFEAVVETVIEEKKANFNKIFQSRLSAEEKLRRLIDNMINTMEKQKQFLSFYVSQIHFSDNPKYARINVIINKFEKITIDQTASIFEQGISEGVFKKFDPYLMAFSFKGIMDSYIFRNIEGNRAIGECFSGLLGNPEKWAKQWLEILYFGIKNNKE